MRRALLTGFGPFRDVVENPSAAVVRVLDGERVAGLDVIGVVLPVTYESVRTRLPDLVAAHRPAVAISLGLGRAPAAALESVARLRARSPEPDVAGVVLAGEPVAGQGPEERIAPWDAEGLALSLSTPELPVVASTDAGGYVCNAALYHLLTCLPAGVPGGFLHLPPAAADPAPDLERRCDLVRRLLRLLA